jgi:hypothetical protein
MIADNPRGAMRMTSGKGALMATVFIVWGCATTTVGSPLPSANTPPPSLAPATAPPPILYPARDPAATYPVIRTWSEVLEFQPFPYQEPLPPAEATEIDGVYGKVEPGEPQWWRCARCPDFRLSGGNWRLMLHEGTMRMYYEVTGFSTVASYELTGERLRLHNDPHCPYEAGEYIWTVEDGALQLTEVEDQCAIHLRAENLTHRPWISCQPPTTEAAITDHWIRPAGCG